MSELEDKLEDDVEQVLLSLRPQPWVFYGFAILGLIIAAYFFSNTDTKNEPNILNGLDVSHYQGSVKWEAIKRENSVKFAFVKATGGTQFVDPKFVTNWHEMRSFGIPRGAYHFFFAAEDPVKQAEHFVSVLGDLRNTDMPPVLDVEMSDGVAADKLSAQVLLWLKTIESKLGRKAIVYTDVSFANEYLNDPALSEYPLWLAEYSSTVHYTPGAWKDKGWTFWQHSPNGESKGIQGNVDLDMFSGGVKDLEAFIKNSILHR